MCLFAREVLNVTFITCLEMILLELLVVLLVVAVVK